MTKYLAFLICSSFLSAPAFAQALTNQMSEAAPAADSASLPAASAGAGSATIRPNDVTDEEAVTAHRDDASGPTDADETPINEAPRAHHMPRAPLARFANEPWAPDIAPVSYFIGYGLRLDHDHNLQNGVDLGAELRLRSQLSAQFQTLFGFRVQDNFGDGNDWHHKSDLWSIFNLGLKWNPLMFILIRHPADFFITGGVLTATSTGGAFAVGTNYYVGVGGTYYFERNVKGILDVRGTPGGHRGFGQVAAGINFQF